MITASRHRRNAPQTAPDAPSDGGATSAGTLRALGPAALIMALSVLAIHRDGAFFPYDWYPAGALALALLVTVVTSRSTALPAGRWPRAALLALLALTALGFASMLWAVWRGAAWDSANQMLLYTTVAWVAAIVPWRTLPLMGLAGAWSIGVAIALGITLVGAALSAHPQTYLIDDQFAAPLGYANATGALAVLAVWPALAVSARPRLHPLASAGLLAVATLLACFAILPQTRAAEVLLAVGALALLALGPNRVRLAARIAILGGAVAFAAGPLLDVYGTAARNQPLGPAMDDAAIATGLATVLAAIACLGLALFESRAAETTWGPRAARGGGRILTGLAIAAAVVFGALNAGRIETSVSDRWDAFRTPDLKGAASDKPRIAQHVHDPKRYDTWRVALAAFRDHPIAGIGGGNFEREFQARRTYQKYSRFAHSIELRVLSEGGLIAGLAFVAFCGAVLGGLAAVRRRGDPDTRVVVAVAAVAALCCVAQASVDWMEQFPSLIVPCLVLIFGALALGAPPRAPRRAAGRGPRRIAVAGAGVALVAAAAVSLALPGLSVRYLERAKDNAASDPVGALHDLDRAAWLDPLLAAPHELTASIRLAGGDERGAAAAYEQAADAEPRFSSYFRLALIASHSGDRPRALRLIDRAARLSPKDPFVLEARDRILAGRRIDPIKFNRLIRNPPLYIRNRLP